jgi:hypothetical protein
VVADEAAAALLLFYLTSSFARPPAPLFTSDLLPSLLPAALAKLGSSPRIAGASPESS